MTQASTLTPPLTHERVGHGTRHGLREVIGTEAWNRLPEAVRERFADTAEAVTYAGAFEIVRASAARARVRVAGHAVRHAGGAARRDSTWKRACGCGRTPTAWPGIANIDGRTARAIS